MQVGGARARPIRDSRYGIKLFATPHGGGNFWGLAPVFRRLDSANDRTRRVAIALKRTAGHIRERPSPARAPWHEPISPAVRFTTPMFVLAESRRRNAGAPSRCDGRPAEAGRYALHDIASGAFYHADVRVGRFETAGRGRSEAMRRTSG